MSYDAHNQASYKLYAILKGVVMQGISNVVRIFFKDQLMVPPVGHEVPPVGHGCLRLAMTAARLGCI